MRLVTAFGTLVLLAAGAIPPLQAQTQSQPQESVAEAARKARAQKKPPAKPVRVYTEENLPKPGQEGEPPAISTVGGESRESDAEKKDTGDTDSSAGTAARKDAEAAAKKGEETGKKEEKSEEEVWRERFRQARENLARAELELNILQRESEKASVQFYSDPSKALKEQFERKEVNEKAAKIAEKRKEIEQLRRALADLEDELRRAGGNPAWAR